VADNVQYNLSEYWLENSRAVRQGYDAMYGGPPYGPSLENWKKYSISFNLDKFHTPLLMEENGYGVTPDRLSVPWNIVLTAEIYTGLTQLKKPVFGYKGLSGKIIRKTPICIFDGGSSGKCKRTMTDPLPSRRSTDAIQSSNALPDHWDSGPEVVRTVSLLVSFVRRLCCRHPKSLNRVNREWGRRIHPFDLCELRRTEW
jgi:hypothetical protein